MSVQSLYTAATGMESLQRKLDVVANNLANVNTTGFKRDRANFEDLFYRHYKMPGAQDSAQQLTPTGISVGLGSRVQSVQTSFEQGIFQQSDQPLDVAIEGQGFLQVIDPATQQTVYTRAGNLSINANGDLVVGSAQTGRVVEPGLQFPPETTPDSIVISPEGLIQTRDPTSTTMTVIGQLQMANFVNPAGLLKLGENLYAETEASGVATAGFPGDANLGLGVLRQGYLEGSNVKPVEELIDLITTQRSFELNSQAVQAGDQILQLIANLRRF